jgi:hypothetical protein
MSDRPTLDQFLVLTDEYETAIKGLPNRPATVDDLRSLLSNRDVQEALGAEVLEPPEGMWFSPDRFYLVVPLSDDHRHDWVNARNEVVVSGSYCSICGLLSKKNVGSESETPQ